jgi:hypothetical protein
MAYEINRSEVVAEVRGAFDRYNAALDANDVAWDSPSTVRFGIGENLFGYAEIAKFRSEKWTPGRSRRLVALAILTLGDDFAITSAVFSREGTEGISRQSQTWARFPEGWRIIAAHVSPLPPQINSERPRDADGQRRSQCETSPARPKQ